MSPQKTLLLGAADGKDSDRLSEALLRLGIRCDRVGAGPQIIERALFERYDAVALDSSIAFLDPRHVRDLLRTNPRTRSLAVYLIDIAGARQGDAEFAQQPAKNMQWLKDLLPKDALAADSGMVTANLREIQLPDMLQMLLTNQRVGVAEVESQDRTATIELAEGGFGRIALGEHKNLKALARILTWHQGSFRFQPREHVVVAQEGSALNLLLDAVRLSDEAEHLRRDLPAGSRLIFVSKTDAAKPANPLLNEVLLLVDFYGAVDDILERLPAPDAEILAAIAKLRDEGWVQVRPPSQSGDGASGVWPDLQPRPTWQSRMPIVWMVGNDADYLRVLHSDSRLQRRLNGRRSLKNAGRFGGNGWVIDMGKGHDFWLRFCAPDATHASFANRKDLLSVGTIAVVSEHDLSDWPTLQVIVQAAEQGGQRCAWLALDEVAHDFLRQKMAAAAPPLLPPADDAASQCWRAIAHVLAA